MTKIKIRKVNGVPMGRPVNEYIYSKQWQEFERTVTEHEAPGCEEGEAEGELQWQHLRNPTTPTSKWQNCDEDDLDYFSEFGDSFQQIWIIPTPEKAEVKEDDYKTITEDEVKNWCSGSFGSSYILERLTDLLKGEYSLEEARDDVLGFRAH